MVASWRRGPAVDTLVLPSGWNRSPPDPVFSPHFQPACFSDEILLEELDYLFEHDETPDQHAYEDRFPQHKAEIARVLEKKLAKPTKIAHYEVAEELGQGSL